MTNRPTMIGYPIVIGSHRMENFDIQLDRFGYWMVVQNRRKPTDPIQFTIQLKTDRHHPISIQLSSNYHPITIQLNIKLKNKK